MNKKDKLFTSEEQALIDVWEAHVRYEFEEKDIDGTMSTMIEGAYVHNIPTLLGGRGLEGVRAFYTTSFLEHLPPDTETTTISRTVGQSQLVDEQIFKCTHTIPMDWMLPGIPPTGKRIEVPLVAIIGFREGKVSSEHIYWDQASVLVQVGLLDTNSLPVVGAESAEKVLIAKELGL
ncbi:MAG: ester cyclase [Gammaproteobacteria bacterium]|nr:ester cyclase [Gammaproteobacteria bacterium]